MENRDIQLLDTAQVARYLGLHPETVRLMAQRGRLPMFRLPSGPWRISEAALKEWIEQASQEERV